MRILLITLTLMFAFATFGAAPASADKIIIVDDGCGHDDHRYRHGRGHKHWKKHHRHHERREAHHRRHNEPRRSGSRGGHFVAVGGPDFGFWMIGPR